MAVASSTYLTLLLHLAAIPFTRMQKSRGASLVPSVVERPGRANCLVFWLSERSVRWVSSHFLQTLEVEALELGPQWLASVALESNPVPVTSCRYPPEMGKAQRRILSIQQ